MVDSNKALATPSFAGLFILIAPFMRWEFTSVDENRRSHKLAPFVRLYSIFEVVVAL